MQLKNSTAEYLIRAKGGANRGTWSTGDMVIWY